jgi:hypothetical protein
MPEDILTPDQKAVHKITPGGKPAAERRQLRLDRMKQRTLLSDCVVMLRYALDESCRLPTTLIDDIAKIDAILVAAGDEPLSERPESLIPKPGSPKTPAEAAKPLAGAAPPQPIPSQVQTGGAQPSVPHGPVASCTGQLKRVTQLDLKDNHPLKSWNACSETIHQHVSPPVSITFIDEETGQQVHLGGTYKIETYKPAPTP